MAIIKANTSDDFQRIETLAYEIIPEFYADVIPHDHNIFFVKKFQTVDAIKEQIDNGYEYYLIDNNNIAVGYFGLQIETEKLQMTLSKLYLLKKYRGLGYGTKAMDLITERANELNLTKIILTVNRENVRTIKLYENYGFSITKELVNKFDNGHTILDFEMTKEMKLTEKNYR